MRRIGLTYNAFLKITGVNEVLDQHYINIIVKTKKFVSTRIKNTSSKLIEMRVSPLLCEDWKAAHSNNKLTADVSMFSQDMQDYLKSAVWKKYNPAAEELEKLGEVLTKEYNENEQFKTAFDSAAHIGPQVADSPYNANRDRYAEWRKRKWEKEGKFRKDVIDLEATEDGDDSIVFDTDHMVNVDGKNWKIVKVVVNAHLEYHRTYAASWDGPEEGICSISTRQNLMDRSHVLEKSRRARRDINQRRT